MDALLFDENHLEIQKMLQRFAREEIAPLAVKRDEEEHFEWSTFQKMADTGLTGIPWPEEYGGAGMDYVAFINAIEEFSKVCGATGSDLAIHTAAASFPIYNFGTEEQKQKYLRPLATGQKMGAFGLTEPSHGSNYQTLQTRAEKDGDEYILNGQKAFISNAGPASIYIIFAMTDPHANKKEGLSAFIVEKGTEGFSIGKPEKKMGIRGHVVAPLNFEDVRIPADNLLGSLGEGFQIAKQTLYGGRMAMSAQALGLAQGAYEQAVDYVQSREQFDQKLSDFQTIRFKLADMAIQLETSRLLVYQAAMLWTKGKKYNTASAMSKAYVSETAMKLTTDVVQLFGGYGFTRDYPVERMMRDAKITSIYTGTAEMQRIEISDEILG